jgi:hypothetical protein
VQAARRRHARDAADRLEATMNEQVASTSQWWRRRKRSPARGRPGVDDGRSGGLAQAAAQSADQGRADLRA